MYRDGGLTGNRTRVQGFAGHGLSGLSKGLAANRPEPTPRRDGGYSAACKPILTFRAVMAEGRFICLERVHG